jgi:Dolichyl-phosphate-mannose-protein mannosyltransferase
MIIIPIVLSIFTHLWNLDGFPDIYRDEDHYLRKTMHVLRGLGPQEESTELVSYPLHPFTHPYFGQLFLAAVLGAFGYPDSLVPSADVSSIKNIYLIPRIIMGLLAIVDTFLLFKVTERRYNRTVAFVASILFAVMPITWMLRRVWLEPIQMPFLLSSILFAMYSSSNVRKKQLTSVILSGMFLGLAIFTKVSTFTMIPLIGYLIFSYGKRNPKLVSFWIIPVILIPLAWPGYALWLGQFNGWVDDVLWQSERENNGIIGAITKLFAIDPIFIILAFSGSILSFLKKDIFMILWLIPFLVFSFLLGYVSYWHLIPLLPGFCIAAGQLITFMPRKFKSWKINKILPYLLVSAIGLFGIVSTILLISLNLTSFHYQVISFISKEIQKTTASVNDKNSTGNEDKSPEPKILTVLGRNYWLWIPKYILDKSQATDYRNYYEQGGMQTNKALLVAGEGFVADMVRDNKTAYNTAGISSLFVNSTSIGTIGDNKTEFLNFSRYPYSGLLDLDPKSATSVNIVTNY